MPNSDARPEMEARRAKGLVARQATRLAHAKARESRNDPNAGHDWAITRRGNDVDIRVTDKAGNDVLVAADVDEVWRLALGLLQALRDPS